MSGSKNGAKSGPKVLRIGVVQGGKIIEERELKRRETVSVGTADKATFTINSEALPKSFDLFDYDGTSYFLRFNEKMDARVQTQGTNEAVSFDKLRKDGQIVKRGNADAVKLSDNSRGKVMVGDVTVLFQFKTAAAAPVRPVLPAEIRGSLLQNIDTQFTLIFVMVAIIQVSIVTWARSLPYIEPTSIDQIDQSYQKLIMPDREPEPPQDQLADNSQADKGEDKKKPEKKAEKKAAKKPAKKAGKEKSARSKESITKKVAGKGLLGVLGSNNSKADGALNDVFEEGGGALGDLGEAFSGIQGVDIASGGEGGTRGGGSGEGVGIGDLATEGGGSVQSGNKTEARVSGSAKAQAPEVDGELSQAEIARVMKRQLKALRDCYERALKRNRSLKGKIIIQFEILENGRTSAVSFDDQMGSPDVVSCIKKRAKYWRFPKPDGGSVFVSYPIIFAPSS